VASAAAMGPASAATSLIGGVVGAVGSVFSADASASMYNFKAGIAQMNATIAQQNAAWAVNSGGIKASEEGLKDAQEIAQTKTNQSASGIDVTTGSHEAVHSDQTDVAKYNQGIIRADAAHTAYGYETQAAADTAEVSLDKASASNAITAGWLGAASSILGGASSVASKWSQGNSIGIGSDGGSGALATGGNIASTATTTPSWIY
jgi:gas vesicle protein